jgi:hypothetical protein
MAGLPLAGAFWHHAGALTPDGVFWPRNSGDSAFALQRSAATLAMLRLAGRDSQFIITGKNHHGRELEAPRRGNSHTSDPYDRPLESIVHRQQNLHRGRAGRPGLCPGILAYDDGISPDWPGLGFCSKKTGVAVVG